jgi:hypothetical protein
MSCVFLRYVTAIYFIHCKRCLYESKFGFILVMYCSVSIGILFQACSPCDNLDCDSDNYFGQFRIISANDGKDLVFGSTRVYEKEKIKFYALKGSDTVNFEYTTVKFGNIGYDSILFVYFFPRVDVAYMDLGDGDVDTLGISYVTTNSKCCGTVRKIANYRFNNRVDIPGNKGTQVILK